MFNVKKLLSIGCISLQLLLSTGLIKAGAGILPYMRDQQGTVFFLLGEDGHRKGSWTDFGGGGKANKTNAIKEGHEETMGVFTGHYTHPHTNRHAARKALRRQSGTRLSSVGGGYATYLCNVTNSVVRQRGRQNTIRRLNSTLNRLRRRNYNHHYTEKRAFVWVSKNALLNAIDNNVAIGNQHVGNHNLYNFFRNILLRPINRNAIANL